MSPSKQTSRAASRPNPPARRASRRPEPVPARERRLEALRTVQRNAILDAAQDVFARQGFHPAKMSDIARQAGFSAGSLYNYFPDGKQEIFETLVRERLGRIYDTLTAELEAERPFAELVGRLATVYAAAMDERRSLFVILFSLNPAAIWNVESAAPDVLTELLRRFTGLLGRLIQRGVDEGVLRSPLPPASLGLLFLGMMASTIQIWLAQDPPRPLHELVPVVLDLFLQGAHA